MTMSYYLAVDVGTSRTAAATARLASDGSFLAVPFALGRNADSTPSAVFVADGELLYGDAAERRGLTQPERLVREFKRRVGDDVPIVAGDQRFAPEELYAGMVSWVVDSVAEREGRQPTSIIVTVPVTWGEYRTGLVEAALEREGWRDVQFITEPEAAARHYEATNPLVPGSALAVYDLGGGTFDAVVLRKNNDGYVGIVGDAVGISDFGGANFDDAVLRHVVAAAGLSAGALAADPTARVGLAALRRECVDAKESLSFDSEAVVPVLLGGNSATVRLTRAELEGMIEAGIERSIDVLHTALDASQIKGEQLDAILLTGGSSRIPRIAQMLSERFDRPIAIDADPKAIIALGALRVLSDRANAAEGAAASPTAAMAVDDETSDNGELIPLHEGDRKGRRWRLPAFAYLSAGSLVVALGLVVASGTALGTGDITDAKNAGSSSFIDDLLSRGLSTGAPEAQAPGAPQAPAAAEPETKQDAGKSTNPANPSPGAAQPGRRTGPAAGTTEKVATPSKAAQPSSSTNSVTNPGTGGGSGTGSSGGSTNTGETGLTTSPPPGQSTPPTTDPTTPPPTTDPTTPPPTTDPTTPPPTTDPTTPPPTTDPTTPPPATDPTTPPPTTDPTTPPPTTDPTTPPSEEPTTPPATESPAPSPSETSADPTTTPAA